MNKGKVRIYELSKELNLDNRDILAICSQQSISVKSHSSTITEAEADQIRAAAEHYTPSHPATPRTAASASSSSSAVSAPPKKPQILEVRPSSRPSATPPASPKRPVSSSQSAAPERTATAPASPSPVRPSASAPARPKPAEPAMSLQEDGPRNGSSAESPSNQSSRSADMTSGAVAAPEAPSAPTPPKVEKSPASEEIASPPPTPATGAPEAASPEAPAEPAPTPKAPKAAPAPKLIKPPARPNERSSGRSSERSPVSASATGSTRPERPTPRGERSVPAPKPKALEIVQVRSGSDSQPRTPESRREGAAPPSPQRPAKPVIELRRPPSRSTPSESDTFEKETEDGVETLADVVEMPRLHRPEPPRQAGSSKKSKNRREDDEDEQEILNRKPASKAKRRPHVIEDDEDVFEDELLDSAEEAAAAQMTLSLARPPKPKSAQSAQAARPPAAVSKPKRPGVRESRRDRREQEVKQERPEIIYLRDEGISVHDLAEQMLVPETEVIKALFFKGIATNINQILDLPTATMVAEEFGILIETEEAEAEARKTEMLDEGDLENLVRRPPVVTIMGHVDHGKTTLLDSIRKTKVAQGEAGGITQHIGAYHVDVEHNGKMEQIVFLDTPGHEAFTAMRARGARVTDIAVLVVAADDGVRPQTIEAISHAKAAEVPIVVAINKVDKEEAQPDRVKQELTEYNLVPEEWGGDTIMVPVSAIHGDNLDSLLEMILLVSEVEDLYANPNRPARGTIIEANLDKSRGPVATLLIQNGTLRVGDTLVAGSAFCKVRAMVDDRGKRVEEAFPSFAVEVLGLSDVPAAGDEFAVYADEKEARSIASKRADEQRHSRLQQAMASRRVTLNSLSAQAQEGDLKELNIVLKADVQGSLEALLGSLQQLPQNEVQIRVLLSAPGEITETDVDLAAASDAVIIGFNTTLASGARQAADNAGVDIREYNIIYKLLEDIQGAMEGLLDPEMVEEPLGQVEVRAVFPVGKGAVAGCYVLSGKAIRNCRVRVRRGNEVVHEGNLDSLKRMKDDVKEVNAGYECGIGLDHFNAWQEGDIIETFRMVSKRRTLTV
jgi:translation initiation factor IF-2